MEYGNKEPVRCKWDDPDLADYLRNQTTFYDDDAISLPSFRGCPRVKRIERWKFVKFEVRRQPYSRSPHLRSLIMFLVYQFCHCFDIHFHCILETA